MSLFMVVEAGLTCLEMGRVRLLMEKADVREEMKDRLNPKELWLAGLDILTKGELELFAEFSLFLSWDRKLGFAKWYLGHSEGLVGTRGVFLDSFLKGSLTMWSWRYHHWWSG